MASWAEYFCTTTLAAIKMIKAQGCPDPYKRAVEEAERLGEVGTTPRKPLFQDQIPTPQVLPGIPNRLQQGSEHLC